MERFGLSLEAAGIARATVDRVRARRSRIAMLFARQMALHNLDLGASDKVILANGLIDALQHIASRSDEPTRESLLVDHASKWSVAEIQELTGAFRAAVEQADVGPGARMIASSWAELLKVYLIWMTSHEH